MKDVISWFSGGVASAVTCNLTIDLYGLDRTRLLFIDTGNEHDDTYRFLTDCERMFGCTIERIRNNKFANIEDVWYQYKTLNTATGAKCSTVLKRQAREQWQRLNTYSVQAFGFDVTEIKRAMSLVLNYPNVKPVFPLLYYGIRKEETFRILERWGIDPPLTYKMGYSNNNCFKTGCVQGGVGYWKKIQREEPEKFEAMANREHELTKLKGAPVTILKDQSNEAKRTGNVLVFLRKNPDHPQLKCIDDMTGKEPENYMECNGFCGLDDLMGSKKI